MNDHIGAFALILVAVIVTAWSVTVEVRSRRARAKALAMRRHPSARTTPDFTSDAARKYHGSDQWGR